MHQIVDVVLAAGETGYRYVIQDVAVPVDVLPGDVIGWDIAASGAARVFNMECTSLSMVDYSLAGGNVALNAALSAFGSECEYLSFQQSLNLLIAYSIIETKTQSVYKNINLLVSARHIAACRLNQHDIV